MDFRYILRFISDELFRWTLFRHRDVHCHVVTGQQSGSHWLNHLLGEVICDVYRVPRPKHIDDRVLIGNPRFLKPLPNVPRIVWTHHAPSPIVHARPFRTFLRFPKYVVLVRDIRAAMVSRYEKRKDDFGISFSEYLRDLRLLGNPNKWDLLKRFSFFNAWGRVAEWMPGKVHIVHYESLRRDTVGELRRVWDFLELPVSDKGVFQRAAEASTKERMSRNEEPGRRLDLVRKDERDPVAWFSDEDRRFFNEQCRRYLKYPLGYNFNNWTSAKLPPQTDVIRRAA
jgi:hypothetical protein